MAFDSYPTYNPENDCEEIRRAKSVGVRTELVDHMAMTIVRCNNEIESEKLNYQNWLKAKKRLWNLVFSISIILLIASYLLLKYSHNVLSMGLFLLAVFILWKLSGTKGMEDSAEEYYEILRVRSDAICWMKGCLEILSDQAEFDREAGYIFKDEPRIIH